MNKKFSNFCYHEKTKRIDNNFVKCILCEQKMINIETPITNKTRQDFTNENKTFAKKFDRHFSNEIKEEVNDFSKVEFYADKNRVNNIIVNKTIKYYGDPIKYHVTINGEKIVLDEFQIDKLLLDTNVMRMDTYQFNNQKD
jgi:hypothetical protein